MLHLKSGRAHALKKALEDLWGHQIPGWARSYGRRWYLWATHSHLEPMKGAAAMVKDHRTGEMNFFAYRITNARPEGLNSKIATLQRRADRLGTSHASGEQCCSGPGDGPLP